jgi:multiple sugar transport system substrate-binding protein
MNIKEPSMVELELSVLSHDPETTNQLLPLLHAFEIQQHIQVNLLVIPWSKGWTEIAKIGIYAQGPDVSEVGTTWVGSLASMQALRAFTPAEVRSLGGREAFFEAVWRTGILPGDESIWAIPWLSDLLVIYYWREALEKAGIGDLQAAFTDHPALVKTLGKLQENGYPYPLALTTINANRNLHEASCWIWSAGGSLMSPDNRKATFTDEASFNGLRNYFSLQPFVSPETLTVSSPTILFENKKVPLLLAGPWYGTVGFSEHPERADQIGIAPILRTTYVGGSSFVIWKHTRHERESYELVRFLSSQPIHIPGNPHSVMLPTRREFAHMTFGGSDIFQRTWLDVLQTGQSFPTVRLWGSIEEKLNQVIANIWAELFADPSEDLDGCLHRHLDPLVERLNLLNS